MKQGILFVALSMFAAISSAHSEDKKTSASRRWQEMCASDVRSSMKSPSSFKFVHADVTTVNDYERALVGLMLAKKGKNINETKDIIKWADAVRVKYGISRSGDMSAAEASELNANMIARYASNLDKESFGATINVGLCFDAANSYGAILRGHATCFMAIDKKGGVMEKIMDISDQKSPIVNIVCGKY